MPDIKETVTKPIGPLPAFAWVIVIVGGYFGYKFLSGRSSSTTSTTAATVGASAGSVAPSSSDYGALTSQVSTLGNQITDLGSKISTIGSTPVSTPVHAQSYSESIGFGPDVPNAPIGILTNYAKDLESFYQAKTGTTYNILTTNPNETPGYLPTNISDSATWTWTKIGSSWGWIGAIPAAMPQFGSNTATPVPTANAVNVASGGLTDTIQSVQETASIPTYSNAPVPSSSLKIPATTPS
jgi:hypothetical protein